MSDGANEDDEFDGEFSHFLKSVHRVKLKDERRNCKILQEELVKNQQTVDTLGAGIYLNKEVAAARSLQPGEAADQAVGVLLTCVTNTTAVQRALNTKYIDAQLEAELDVQMEISKVKVNPESMQMLNTSMQLIHGSTEQCRILDSVKEKQRQMVQRRLELAKLHVELHRLWSDSTNKEIVRDLARDTSTDTPEMLRLRDKLRNRRECVEMMVHLMMTVVTGTSSDWGKGNKTRRILQACELFTVSAASGSPFDTVLAMLARIPL